MIPSSGSIKFDDDDEDNEALTGEEIAEINIKPTVMMMKIVVVVLKRHDVLLEVTAGTTAIFILLCSLIFSCLSVCPFSRVMIMSCSFRCECVIRDV